MDWKKGYYDAQIYENIQSLYMNTTVLQRLLMFCISLSRPSAIAIKEMEEYYGTRFFERIGRHISPTGAGNELYRYALHIIELFDEMEQKIKDWVIADTPYRCKHYDWHSYSPANA